MSVAVADWFMPVKNTLNPSPCRRCRVEDHPIDDWLVRLIFHANERRCDPPILTTAPCAQPPKTRFRHPEPMPLVPLGNSFDDLYAKESHGPSRGQLAGTMV